MKLEHDFTVPAAVDEAWKVLLDVERIAPCMPGATLLSIDGETFTGSVRVKVGPIQVTYKGEAKFAELDESSHRAVIEAAGKEARGSGTAAATVTATLTALDATSTKVDVVTDLNVTGRPAQFGRGVMADVGSKLIGQFATCLAKELATPPAPAPAPAATEPPAAAATPAEQVTAAPAAAPTATQPLRPEAPPTYTPPPRPMAEPIDLLDVAGGSVAKRLAPLAAALALLLLVLWRRRRH